MYIHLKTGVVLVRGPKAFGIYDLNHGKFYRVNKEAGNLLLQSNQNIDLKKQKLKQFILDAQKKELLEIKENIEKTGITNLADVIHMTRELKFAWIELTGKCNQNCKHCFMGNDLNANPHYEKEKIFSYIDYLISCGISQIILTGGEPTLHPDIEQILDYIAQYDVDITLLTNGTTPRLPSLIPKLKDYGVKTKISILGIGKNHDEIVGLDGAFNKIKDIIELFINMNAPIKLGMTVCSLNIKDVDKVRDYANQLKVHFEASPIYPIGKAKFNHNELFKHTQEEYIKVCKKDKKRQIDIREYTNTASRKIKTISPYDYEAVDLHNFLTDSFECGQKIIAILSNRKVTPCLLLRTDKYMMGNLLESRLDEILEYDYPKRKEFNKMMKLSNISGCKDCEALYICKAGGCPAVTESIYGDIKKKNPYFSSCYYSGEN
jgi:radical SAM protein with 4Fe4S-binding SPASM domain